MKDPGVSPEEKPGSCARRHGGLEWDGVWGGCAGRHRRRPCRQSANIADPRTPSIAPDLPRFSEWFPARCGATLPISHSCYLREAESHHRKELVMGDGTAPGPNFLRSRMRQGASVPSSIRDETDYSVVTSCLVKRRSPPSCQDCPRWAR